MVCTAQPATEAASVHTSPPWTRPIGLYTDSSGVHSKTTRPWSTLVGDMFSSRAIGGGGILPSISARMNSSPDRPAPPATVAAWSYQVTTLDRGAPHAAGCPAGLGLGRPRVPAALLLMITSVSPKSGLTIQGRPLCVQFSD